MLNLVREGEEGYIEAIRYRRRLKIFENFLFTSPSEPAIRFFGNFIFTLFAQTFSGNRLKFLLTEHQPALYPSEADE